MTYAFSCLRDISPVFDLVRDMEKRGEVEVNWGTWMSSIYVQVTVPTGPVRTDFVNSFENILKTNNVPFKIVEDLW